MNARVKTLMLLLFAGGIFLGFLGGIYLTTTAEAGCNPGSTADTCPSPTATNTPIQATPITALPSPTKVPTSAPTWTASQFIFFVEGICKDGQSRYRWTIQYSGSVAVHVSVDVVNGKNLWSGPIGPGTSQPTGASGDDTSPTSGSLILTIEFGAATKFDTIKMGSGCTPPPSPTIVPLPTALPTATPPAGCTPRNREDFFPGSSKTFSGGYEVGVAKNNSKLCTYQVSLPVYDTHGKLDITGQTLVAGGDSTVSIGPGETKTLRVKVPDCIEFQAELVIGEIRQPPQYPPELNIIANNGNTLNACVTPTPVPTKTPTPVPPTSTPVPPTATPVPPTATSTPTATPTPPPTSRCEGNDFVTRNFMGEEIGRIVNQCLTTVITPPQIVSPPPVIVPFFTRVETLIQQATSVRETVQPPPPPPVTVVLPPPAQIAVGHFGNAGLVGLNRTTCGSITGTDYESYNERVFYLNNCAPNLSAQQVLDLLGLAA